MNRKHGFAAMVALGLIVAAGLVWSTDGQEMKPVYSGSSSLWVDCTTGGDDYLLEVGWDVAYEMQLYVAVLDERTTLWHVLADQSVSTAGQRQFRLSKNQYGSLSTARAKLYRVNRVSGREEVFYEVVDNFN